MKATEINDFTICKANADWILHQINELRALLSCNSENMIVLNKTRALSALDCIKNSAEEMRLYIEGLN